jgi:hypothetical protein
LEEKKMNENQKALEIVVNGLRYVDVLKEANAITIDQQADIFAAYVNGACQYAGVTADEITGLVDEIAPNNTPLN